ncbi:MAG: hypothetical protein RBQ97_11870 [Acholeplasma sp.]|nr:hypothetical protein [Acholeplasma sp.]
MAENRFDDTRSSIQKLTSIFFESRKQNRFRNLQFEDDVIQVITRKSIRNFELFAYAFDSIFDNRFDNSNEFNGYILRERLKDSRDKKLLNLYFSETDSEDREKTIDLAFRIYKQHLAMIDVYEGIYSNANKVDRKFESKIFDENFNTMNYKYVDISFDVFLSHRYYLRFYNIIVFYILTVHYDLVVYVDWIFDYNLDRKKLSEETVKLLKYRMSQSKKLIFYNISNSITTNWMAWEVGYFSCLREKSIGILDLDGYCTGNKNVEVLSSNDKILFDVSKGLYMNKSKVSIGEWINRK